MKAGEKEEGAGILKQQRIKEFFEKKVKAQHLSGPDLGDNGNNKGATLSSPLLGVAGSPVHTSTSKVGRGSIPVVRGGVGAKKEGRKRAPVVLERWFGPRTPRSDCSGTAEERKEPETCPGKEFEDSKVRR